MPEHLPCSLWALSSFLCPCHLSAVVESAAVGGLVVVAAAVVGAPAVDSVVAEVAAVVVAPAVESFAVD